MHKILRQVMKAGYGWL